MTLKRKATRMAVGRSAPLSEPRTSTGSEVFSLLTCLDDIKFVFLSFFTVIEAIWLKICAKPPSKNQKRPLPVDVRRSRTLLLKLPTVRPAPICLNFLCALLTKLVRSWGLDIDQYSATLTEQAWSIKDLLHGRNEHFCLRNQREKSRVGNMSPFSPLG